MSDNSFENVLAIDTSSSMLRLALQFGHDRIAKLSEDVGISHGSTLMRKIQDLLDSAGIAVGQIDAVVACTGPGSFTGLRVGLAAVKGIAQALDIPVVGVSLFDIAAAGLRSHGGPVCVVLPFKRDACFVAVVTTGRFDPEAIEAVPLDRLAAFLNGRAVTTIGLDLPPSASPPASTVPARIEYDAADLLRLGLARLTAEGPDDLGALEPLYIQKSQAELRFEQRRKNR